MLSALSVPCSSGACFPHTCIRNRILNSPLSGFGCAVPHSGPPALPKKTASASSHFFSTASVTESLCLSSEQPPQRSKCRSNLVPVNSSTMSNTLSASATTSGPMWSPGRTRILPPLAGTVPSIFVTAFFAESAILLVILVPESVLLCALTAFDELKVVGSGWLVGLAVVVVLSERRRQGRRIYSSASKHCDGLPFPLPSQTTMDPKFKYSPDFGAQVVGSLQLVGRLCPRHGGPQRGGQVR